MNRPTDDFDPRHNDQTMRTQRLTEIDEREEKRWKWVQVMGGVLVAAVSISLAVPRYIRSESHEAEHEAALGELRAEMKGLETKVDMLIMFSARQNAQTDAVAKTIHAPLVPEALKMPPTNLRDAAK